MADPTTPTPVPQQTAPDREAAIEQLLLTGLDHYFAGRFEQAIHLWTRILFLDRGHTRARAYIERARLAIAESQRAQEERQWRAQAVHVHSGDADVARSIEPPNLPPARDPRGAESTPAIEPATRTHRREAVWPHVALTIVSLVLLAAAAFIATEGDTVSRWMLSPTADSSAVELVNEAGPLPVPDTSRMLVERARGLFARGHVREALDLLELIRSNDVAKTESDVLRGELQRALLDAGGFPAASASPASR